MANESAVFFQHFLLSSIRLWNLPIFESQNLRFWCQKVLLILLLLIYTFIGLVGEVRTVNVNGWAIIPLGFVDWKRWTQDFNHERYSLGILAEKSSKKTFQQISAVSVSGWPPALVWGYIFLMLIWSRFWILWAAAVNWIFFLRIERIVEHYRVHNERISTPTNHAGTWWWESASEFMDCSEQATTENFIYSSCFLLEGGSRE